MTAHGSQWEQKWKPQAYAALKAVFSFEAFRGVQQDAVRAALEGRDTFVLMPTGGGKSLCYALPAVVRGGLVLVVSPLIALMQDQVSALQALGIAADYLSSTRTAAERKAVLARLTAYSHSQPQLAMLYVTPELLATDSFRQRLASLHASNVLQMLVVDEAHCISQWGHDFRPAYRQLAQLRSQLRGLHCMALTATATAQVQQDIVSSLRMHNPVFLVTSFNRPNIHYTVILLDAQPAPDLSHFSSSSSTMISSSLSTRHAGAGSVGGTAGAAAGGRAGAGHSNSSSKSLGAAAFQFAAGTDSDNIEAADVDLAGYRNLLQLLKPAGRPRQQQNRNSENGSQQRPQQHQSSTDIMPGSKAWQGPIAIVYALKRSTVDVLVRRLSSEGLAVAGYHAALPDAVRADVLERWRAGKLQVVVATVAFGMGVDKGDIELVVHMNLPRSVESFYQESGRAGRNGQQARSVLFYSTRDRRRMDYILQKDADSKAARKRKRAAKPTAANPQHSNNSSATATPPATEAGEVDPVAAAPALRAFGAVVDLCTQPGCRRAKLLKHFGENYHPQQHHGQAAGVAGSRLPPASSCCDYCDNPSSIEAAVVQLKDTEIKLLQRWRDGRQWSSSKRQKHREGGTFADGFGGSDTSDETGSANSDADIELDSDSAAAAAAVAKAAEAAKATSKQGDTGNSTDAFLAAMMRAEQRHNKQQCAAAAAVEADPLQRLLAAKESGAAGKQVPGGLTDAVRASRRAKLAALIAANPNLTGCTAQVAADVAAAMEATVAGPGTAALQHRACVSKLATAVRTASSWQELPGLQQLSGKSLEVVLKHAVRTCCVTVQQLRKSKQEVRPVANGSAIGEPDSKDDEGAAATEASKSDRAGIAAAVSKLLALAKVPVTIAVLEATGVAKHIKVLKKHPVQQVAAAAGSVIAAWRAAVTQ